MFERGVVRRWQTVVEVDWAMGHKDSGASVIIPVGFEFESSVPWWARWFLHPDDPRFLLAACVHDYLIEIGAYGWPQAAAEWFDGAKAGGAPLWKARLCFIAIAAWSAFRSPGSSSEASS